jgi:F0F1-type ATP synthase membrane subunit b/b'
MLAFVYSSILILAASGGSGEGGFTEFWEKYLNYPGFEIWKFVNLGIFVYVLSYLIKRPLTDAFKAKREVIRAELIKAEEEKKAALAKLAETEARLVGIESEKTAIQKAAREEIEAEKLRLAAQAESEAKKLRDQAAGEVVRIGQVARLQLKRFAIDESIRLAEEKLRGRIDSSTDAKLVGSGIQAIGGLN